MTFKTYSNFIGIFSVVPLYSSEIFLIVVPTVYKIKVLLKCSSAEVTELYGGFFPQQAFRPLEKSNLLHDSDKPTSASDGVRQIEMVPVILLGTARVSDNTKGLT